MGLRLSGEPAADLAAVAAAFTRLPYENLSKILRHADSGGVPHRSPQIVLAEFKRYGAGGTCFALAATLLHLVRSLGLRAEPILADRSYGPNTHCALFVWLDGLPHLVDPGYLVADPVPIDLRAERRIAGPFNDLVLTPDPAGRIHLATAAPGAPSPKRRALSYRTDPAAPEEFMAAWDASFDWDMMHYPLLSRVVAGEQIYLQNNRLQRRTRGGVCVERLAMDQLAPCITRWFGVDAAMASRAVRTLQGRGDLPHG
jgi:arylamine N-acetyltransferase